MNDLILRKNGALALNKEAAQTIASLQSELAILKAQSKALEDSLKPFKEKLKEEMDTNNILVIKDEDTGLKIKLTRKADSYPFDEEAFKKDHEDLYMAYLTIKHNNPSMTISVK